jgi:hypothetical protein
LAFAKVTGMAAKKLQAKAVVVFRKETIFDAATSLSLNQEMIKRISNFCNEIILEEVTQ